MYGIVNKAMEDLVRTNYGHDTWQQIVQEAGLDTPIFIGSEGYPDQMTYQLVAAVSKVIGLPPEQVLAAFGEWWILKTGQEEYGSYMRAAGRTLPEFIENLPLFHDRVIMFLPDLQPPSFSIRQRSANSITLRYESQRQGLAPMVMGMLNALGKMFNTAVRVTHEKRRDAECDHDEFLIEW